MTETTAEPQQQSETTAEKKPQGNLIFALDIGTRTVVGILGEQIDDCFHLRDCVVEPHTKRAMVDGQVEDIKQAAKIVSKVKQELEERNSVRLERVAIAAAGRALRTSRVYAEYDIAEKDIITDELVKSMEIETIQKAQAKLDEESKSERQLFYCVGHSIIRYTLDTYKIISLSGHKGSSAGIELIAAFLPSVVVEGLYAVMDLVGLEVNSLTLEPIAAMNVIIPPEIRLINIALVDIGAGTSDIAIARDGSIVAYAMATIAGDEITEEIIKTFFVDFNTAENMKQSCGSGEEEIEFKDIFGIPHTIKTTEFFEKIIPAVEMLAGTICDSIVDVNDGPPSAVFLVGGGALVNGLTHQLALKLGIDAARVAVGSYSFLKNVDTEGKKLGAEFVTPLGIGVTAVLNQGYDFSVINLNDEKIRIFDTKQLSVYDLLNIAGYKSTEIMGRSGHSLIFNLNGRRNTIKGGMLIPAEVEVNGRPAGLTERVTQGDKVTVKKAVCGEDASATIAEAVDISRYHTGFVTFAGVKHKIGVELFANGQPVGGDYQIKPLDEIQVVGILTIAELMESLEVETDGVIFVVNGLSKDKDYILSDGDEIVFGESVPAEEPIISDYPLYDEEEVADSPESAKQAVQTADTADVFEDYADNEGKSGNAETESEAAPQKTDYPAELYGEITVNLNYKDLTLPENRDKTPHVFIELLNYVDLDIENHSGDYVLLLNSAPANFNDMLKSGDTAIIRWES